MKVATMADDPRQIPHNLPTIPEFYGVAIARPKEVELIADTLSSRVRSVVSISGVGGVGKTTVALLAAYRSLERNEFPGGIVWIDCGLNITLSEILETIERTLQVEAVTESSPRLRDRVIARLQKQPVLLILDNFELVAGNDEIYSFLARLPRATKVLLTSREQIRVPGGEHTIRLSALSESTAIELLRANIDATLLRDLANEQLRELASATSGLPLAIVLVAAMLKQGSSVAQILDNLNAGGRSLYETLLRNTGERLGIQERRLLDALTVFRNPAEARALFSVANMEYSESTINSLVALWLIDLRDGHFAFAHPLIEAYFRRELAPRQLSALQKRMVNYFVRFLAEAKWDFNRLEREWPNIEYAIELAIRQNVVDNLGSLVMGIGVFALARGHEEKYKTWLEDLRKISAKKGDQKTEAAALHNLGIHFQRAGMLQLAIEQYGQSLHLSDAIGDQSGKSRTLAQIGTAYRYLGELRVAEDYAREALAIAESLGDELAESSLLVDLGDLSLQRGIMEEAARHFERALTIKRNIGDQQGASIVLMNLGDLHRKLAITEKGTALARSIDFYEQALKISRSIGDVEIGRAISIRLGEALGDMYDLTASVGYAEQAELVLNSVLSTPSREQVLESRVQALVILGNIHITRHERTGEINYADRAESELLAALENAERTGQLRLQADVQAHLGRLYASRYGRTGILIDAQRAEAAYRVASKVYEQEYPPRAWAVVHTNLGNLAVSQFARSGVLADAEKAESEYRAAAEVLTRESDPTEWATVISNLGRLQANLYERTGFEEHARDALVAFQQASEVWRTESSPIDSALLSANTANLYQQLAKNHDRDESLLAQAIHYYEIALAVLTPANYPAQWRTTIASLSTAYAEIRKWDHAKQLANQLLEVLHGASIDRESLITITEWYRIIADQARQSGDDEFAVRVIADIAFRYQIEQMAIPSEIRSLLTDLRDRLGLDRFIIIWAKVQGTLTPMIAQLLQEARVLMRQELFDEAGSKLSAILALLKDSPSPDELTRQRATILFLRGLCRRHLGEWPLALADQRDALEVFERLKDHLGAAHSLLEIGYLLELMNNYDDAQLNYADAYRMYRRVDDKGGMAAASGNLGRLEYRIQNFAAAIRNLEEAFKLYSSLGDMAKAAEIEPDLEAAKLSQTYKQSRLNIGEKRNERGN